MRAKGFDESEDVDLVGKIGFYTFFIVFDLFFQNFQNPHDAINFNELEVCSPS